jgi:hypothetical protein
LHDYGTFRCRMAGITYYYIFSGRLEFAFIHFLITPLLGNCVCVFLFPGVKYATLN